METKLTLRLDKQVIESAKIYAHNQNISLSKMVESYLEFLTKKKDKESDITPLVASLSGVIHLENELDYKEDYANYLTNKYR
jgi:hypothetical protein